MSEREWTEVDVERFLTDYCDVLGMSASSVTLTYSPSPIDPNFPTDRLTGRPPLDTCITVQIGDDAVSTEGIDLAEAVEQTMASISLRRYPRPPSHRDPDELQVDDSDPSCQIASGQRVWFVEGAEPPDDKLLVADEETNQRVVIDHATWNPLLSAVAYFQQMHCESCPDVTLAVPDEFVLIPGIE